MNIRGLFKPTLSKIALLIVILVLTFFIPKSSHELCEKIIPEDLTMVSCYQRSINGIGYPIFYGERFLGYVIIWRFYPLMFVINLVIYYILSCVIIFLFQKFKK